MNLTRDHKMSLYRQMLVIRAFEKKIDFFFTRGLIKGTCHVCIGQEAVPAALCAALKPDDYAVGTHRGHGLAIAKGVSPRALLAEILGKAEGVCGGRGGSQHSACAQLNFLGTNGITGGGIPLAAGAAAACKHFGNGRIVAVALGDGATNEGVFHEALNIASLWSLPLLLVCENNLYGMSTPVRQASAEPELWKGAAAYRIEASRVDGNDLAGLLDVMDNAVRKVRNETRPVFVECMTYRWMGHSKSDPRNYRSKEEEAEWRARCPIKLWKQCLAESGIAMAEIEQVEKDVNHEMERLTSELTQSPSVSAEKLFDHVYAN